MRAVLLTGHGGLEKLEYREDVPDPVPAEGEALVRVAACGLNNTDINTRTAWYSKGVEQGITESGVVGGYDEANDQDGSWGNSTISFPVIQGADVCGTVESVNGGSQAFVGKRVMIDPWFLDPEKPGDLSKARYFGSEVNGGYAEFTVAPIGNRHFRGSQLFGLHCDIDGCHSPADDDNFVSDRQCRHQLGLAQIMNIIHRIDHPVDIFTVYFKRVDAGKADTDKNGVIFIAQFIECKIFAELDFRFDFNPADFENVFHLFPGNVVQNFIWREGMSFHN